MFILCCLNPGTGSAGYVEERGRDAFCCEG